MMSSIFYGEIKEDRLNTWKENKNPYDILADNNRIERLGGWDFLFIVDELFTDCVQVDWGSFAYKCTKEQPIELTRKTKCAISGIELLKPEKIYGIVFIEITCKASVCFDSSGGFIIIAFAFNSEFVPTPILSIDPPDLP